MTFGGKWAACLTCGVLFSAPLTAVTGGPSEYEVKAAFVFNFSKYVEWPESTFATAADPISICVVGENPFGTLLEEAVRGKSVNGRQIVVRETTTIPDTCHIAFIASSERERLDAILGKLARRPVLTVSDAEAVAERGAIIGLTIIDKRVRFEINMVAAKQAGVKLSSQLLKIAIRLIGQRDQGR
jgi:hypothetical protein